MCRLLLDELVANAVTHGDSDVEVTVNVTDLVRVDVTNRGTDGEVAPIPYERGEPASHFGLHLVHGLSTSWGVTRDDDTTTVWFELPHPEATEPFAATARRPQPAPGANQGRPSAHNFR